MTIDRTSPDDTILQTWTNDLSTESTEDGPAEFGTWQEVGPVTIADLCEQAILVRDNLVEDLARARKLRDDRNAEIKVLVGQLEEAERAVKALTPRAKKAAK